MVNALSSQISSQTPCTFHIATPKVISSNSLGSTDTDHFRKLNATTSTNATTAEMMYIVLELSAFWGGAAAFFSAPASS